MHASCCACASCAAAAASKQPHAWALDTRCCCLRRQEIGQRTSKAAELEASCRKLNARVQELSSERDKHASRAQLLDTQLAEAQQALCAAQAAAALQLQLQQQQALEALAAAEAQAQEAQAQLQRQLESAQAVASSGSEAAAAAAAEREASLSAALHEARAAASAQQAAAEEHEQRQRRAVQHLQEQVRQLEAEKQVSAATGAAAALCVS